MGCKVAAVKPNELAMVPVSKPQPVRITTSAIVGLDATKALEMAEPMLCPSRTIFLGIVAAAKGPPVARYPALI